MKRALLLGLAILSLALSACGGTAHARKEEFLRLRADRLSRGKAQLRASVRADYGLRVYDFVLRYEGDGESGTLTVEEPALIRGVEATLGKEGVRLEYDGALLDTGAILAGLSPLEAFPLLLRAWDSGCVTDCWKETWQGEACLTAEIDLTGPGGGEEILCRSRFRLPEGQPLTAEFSVRGSTVISCVFLPWEDAGSGV